MQETAFENGANDCTFEQLCGVTLIDTTLRKKIPSYYACFTDDIFDIANPQGVDNLRFSVIGDPRPQRCH
eukprot:14054166-Ditylum_brightwellii.AAC.1